MLDELVRRQAIERCVRSLCVVVESPFFDRAACVKDRWERVLVEELVADSTVKTLDTPVLRWFSGIDKVLRHSCRRRDKMNPVPPG